MMTSSMETFSALGALLLGIHRSPVNSPHKDQWHGVLIYSLICAWSYGWVNNRYACNLRRHRTHYDVSVMLGVRDGHGLKPTQLFCVSPRRSAQMNYTYTMATAIKKEFNDTPRQMATSNSREVSHIWPMIGYKLDTSSVIKFRNQNTHHRVHSRRLNMYFVSWQCQ